MMRLQETLMIMAVFIVIFSIAIAWRTSSTTRSRHHHLSRPFVALSNVAGRRNDIKDSRLCPEEKTNLSSLSLSSGSNMEKSGNLHGVNSCFLPLKQLGQDSYTPRTIQIAGGYPGITRLDFFAARSEPAAPIGQWDYGWLDPNGPNLGSVALDGSAIVAGCEDPVMIIAEHSAIGVQLPDVIEGPVDLLVLVDRANKDFEERRFLVLEMPGQQTLSIAAFCSKKDIPEGTEILGRVELVQVPWLPGMGSTKTGFMEADEYF